MSFTKYAKVEEILEIRSSANRIPFDDQSYFSKFASLPKSKGKDYLYVRCRAISSRVNKNHDGWPSSELAKAYKSFIGKPIFVDHNNDDPKRTRGVIVDSTLHVEDEEKVSAFDAYYATAPDNHKPPTWVELLLEIDAKTFPKLAKAIRNGDIDAVSMGANIKSSVCSICTNEAESPAEYCDHLKAKGATFEIVAENGEKTSKKSYEDCIGISFFEISNVFDPADPTADILEKVGKTEETPVNTPEQIALVEKLTQKTAKVAVDWRSEQPLDPNFQAQQIMDCPYCGSKVDLKTNYDRINESIICPYCGMEFDPEDLKHWQQYNSKVQWRIAKKCPDCHGDHTDKILKEEWDGDNLYKCLDCKKNYRFKETAVFDPGSQDWEGPRPEDIGEAPTPEFTPHRQDENARVVDWKFQQLVGAGIPEEVAGQLANNTQLDYKQAIQMFQQGASPQQLLQILSSKIAWKLAAPNDLPTMKQGPKPDQGERQIGYVPQSDMISSPAEVDTLRKEIPCPNCHADNLTADPDGMLKCPTCSYVNAPHPLDDPDLSIHQTLDGESQPQPDPQTEEPLNPMNQGEDLSQIRIYPKGQNMPQPGFNQNSSTIKNKTSSSLISEMNWTIVANTVSVDTFIGNPKGITAETYKVFVDNKLSATITYPNGEVSNIPFGNPTREMVNVLKNQKEAGFSDPSYVPINVETTYKDLEDVLEVIHTGAIIPKKKVLSPTSPKTEAPQPARVVSDQAQPVTSKAEVIEEVIVPEKDEKKLLVAFTIADAMVESGLITAEEKLNKVAELEQESLEQLEARKSTVEMVKNSSVKKISRVVGRMPRFSSFSSEVEETTDSDEPDEAIFL